MCPRSTPRCSTGWARAAIPALERHRAEIGRINVFPVAGRRHRHQPAAHHALAADAAPGSGGSAGRDGDGRPTDGGGGRGARPRGAARGARQLRGDPLAGAARGWRRRWRRRRRPGADVPRGRGRAADALADALCPGSPAGRPRPSPAGGHGALGARRRGGRPRWPRGSDRLDDGRRRRRTSRGAAALRATTGQLPELARAGVVDAGGMGLSSCWTRSAAAGHRRRRRRRSSWPRRPGRRARGVRRPCCTGPRASRTGRLGDSTTRSCTCSTAPTTPASTRCAPRLDALGDASRWSATAPALWTRARALHRHRRRDRGRVAAGRPHRITVARYRRPVDRARAGLARDRAVLLWSSGRSWRRWPARSARTRAVLRLPEPGDRRPVDEAEPRRRRWPARPRAARRAAARRRRARRARPSGRPRPPRASRAGGAGDAHGVGAAGAGRARRARPGRAARATTSSRWPRPRRAPGPARCWSPRRRRSPGSAAASPATCWASSTARWC